MLDGTRVHKPPKQSDFNQTSLIFLCFGCPSEQLAIQHLRFFYHAKGLCKGPIRLRLQSTSDANLIVQSDSQPPRASSRLRETTCPTVALVSNRRKRPYIADFLRFGDPVPVLLTRKCLHQQENFRCSLTNERRTLHKIQHVQSVILCVRSLSFNCK